MPPLLKSKRFVISFLLALVLFGGYFWLRDYNLPRLDIKSTAEGDFLVLIKGLEIKGLDEGGASYIISAEEAERSLLDDANMRLISITGFLTNSANAPDWHLYANEGRYNQDADTFDLAGKTLGDVRLVANDGTNIDLENLFIDIKHNHARTDKELRGVTTLGRIDAKSANVDFHEQDLRLMQARIHIEPPAERKAATPPETSTPISGRFTTDANAPLDVSTPALHLNQKTRRADFIGSPNAPSHLQQGGLHLHAERMRLDYNKERKPTSLRAHNPSGARIEIISDNGRRAFSERAHYRFAEEMLVLEGAVELLAPPTAQPAETEQATEQIERLTGEVLYINMATGESRMTGAQQNTNNATSNEENNEENGESGKVRIELSN